ncbi:MAG: hypothetical protein AAGD01_05050 [Acidobacteriota bacterium]
MTSPQDPTTALREAAAAYPDIIAGTSCNQTSYKAGGKKAYFYIGPGAKGIGYKAMFKLDDSLQEAIDLAEIQPKRFEVGRNNWITVRFTDEEPLTEEIWKRWLEESYGGATKGKGGKKG